MKNILVIMIYCLLKILRFLLCATVIILLGWLVFSYIDVVMNNLDKVPQYANWNIFEIFF